MMDGLKQVWFIALLLPHLSGYPVLKGARGRKEVLSYKDSNAYILF
jgi:hypothetical protein